MLQTLSPERRGVRLQHLTRRAKTEGLEKYGKKGYIRGMRNIANRYTSKISAFIRGYTSAFDISGRTFKFPDLSNGFQRDGEALRGDWERIGNDMRKVMDIVAHEQQQ